MIVGAVLIAVALLLAGCHAAHRRHERLHGPYYVQQIQSLKSETPLALPAIRPLTAQVARPKRPRKAKPALPFQQQRKGVQ